MTRLSNGTIILEPTLGYSRAKDILYNRFGTDYLVSQAWLDTLLKFQFKNEASSLQQFADLLLNCVHIFKYLGNYELGSLTNITRIVEKLPVYIQRRRVYKSCKFRREGKQPNIEHLSQLVSEVAEEANDPVALAIAKKNNKPKVVNAYSADSNSGRSSADRPKSEFKNKCVLCQSLHSTFKCEIVVNKFKILAYFYQITFKYPLLIEEKNNAFVLCACNV